MRTSMGERIKRLRKAAGLSQQKLADELGISIKSIQRYEKNANEPSRYVTKLIATYFAVSTDYLLGVTAEQTQMNNTYIREE